VVPVSAEHQPVGTEDATLLLIEPSGTPNTGDAATAAPRTVI
jgi:mannose-6-phosphate isomerase-like protein (cupin superfamily)